MNRIETIVKEIKTKILKRINSRLVIPYKP